MSERAADVLVEPPLRAFYAARGSETSLAFFLMFGRYANDSAILAPSPSWTALLAHAARRCRHEAEVSIDRLERLPDGTLVASAADGRLWRGVGAVIATDPREASKLLESLGDEDDSLGAWLNAVPLRPTFTLALALDQALVRDAFGVFADPAEASVVSACAIQGAKTGIDAPADREIVLAWPTPDAAARLVGLGAEEIVSAMLSEVTTLVPGSAGRVQRARVYRFAGGTPVAAPGFAADRARGRALAAAVRAPVALAGDYLAAPLIEGAVASGELAAQALLERMTRSRT